MANKESLEQLLKYIIEDDIDKIGNNWSIIIIYLNKLPDFLNKYKRYKNNTWIYIKGIYFYLTRKYKEMLNLLKNIDESNILTLQAQYYEEVNRIELCIKCYERAIELKNSHAMYSLGMYYRRSGNIFSMRKYLDMAIELNNVNAIFYLVGYYMGIYDSKINGGELIKYCLMGINLNCLWAHKDLMYYCREIEKDESKYYDYVYYPRFLTMLICIRRINLKHKFTNNPNNLIFIPDEILILLFNKHIKKTKKK